LTHQTPGWKGQPQMSRLSGHEDMKCEWRKVTKVQPCPLLTAQSCLQGKGPETLIHHGALELATTAGVHSRNPDGGSGEARCQWGGGPRLER
jgi:hypothetical protein